MKGLTDKQKEIVNFIGEFMGAMEMAPTIYEIAEHFGIKTSTVFAHIRALQKKNVLQRSSKARSISLAKNRRKHKIPSGAHSVPVLDSAEAGHDPAADGELICDSKVFSKTLGGKDIFAMHVKGADASGFGILDGDLILVQAHPTRISSGDILLLMENGHPVLFSCDKSENGIFELKSGNSEQRKISVRAGEIPIRGVIVGLQRSL